MMKRLIGVLLVVAFLFGLGSALSAFVTEPVVADDGPVYPQPIVPWPPENSNSTTADGPVYPQPIVPWPPENNNSITT